MALAFIFSFLSEILRLFFSLDIFDNALIVTAPHSHLVMPLAREPDCRPLAIVALARRDHHWLLDAILGQNSGA